MSSKDSLLASKEDLNAELHALLQRAHENGIDVRGAFDCRNGAEHPDWDVVITEVVRAEHSE